MAQRSVVLTKQVLVERLLALVPRPRRHLVTYHDVLAPAASLRSRVVPRVAGEDEDARGQDDAANGDSQQPESQQLKELHKVGSPSRRRARVPHRPAKRRGNGRRYYTWAELLRRVYAIHDPLSVAKLLRAEAKAGRMDGKEYAALSDRKAQHNGKMQLYGMCHRFDPKRNMILPPEIAGIEKTNHARAELGIPPLKEYLIVKPKQRHAEPTNAKSRSKSKNPKRDRACEVI